MPELPDFYSETRLKRGAWKQALAYPSVPNGVITSVLSISGRGVMYLCRINHWLLADVKNTYIKLYVDSELIFNMTFAQMMLYRRVQPYILDAALSMYDPVNNYYDAVVGVGMEFDESFEVKLLQTTGANKTYGVDALYGLF